ncbi:MAG: iron-sulfur cluster assembly scaffold protein [Candidatus Zixiibacteriota bacterium]
MYNDTVMDHFQNPRNTGDMPDPDGLGQVGNPACGDVMRLYIRVVDNRLVDIRCQTFGCAAAIACASAASEMVMGKSLDEAFSLTRDQVAAYLNGLPEHKMACSNLAPDAVRAAIEDYRAKFTK